MNIDLQGVAAELEQNYLNNVTYVESEGDDCLRIDYGNEQSIWLYENGKTMGKVGKATQKFLEKKGFQFS